MKTVLATLKAHIEQHPPNYGDAESVLSMLYECYRLVSLSKPSRRANATGCSISHTAAA